MGTEINKISIYKHKTKALYFALFEIGGWHLKMGHTYFKVRRVTHMKFQNFPLSF